MQILEDHPLANIFPLIEGEDFAALVADIRAHGLHDPIDVYQGKILDGRNRYRAIIAAGIEVEKRHIRTFHAEFYGDPLTYVLSKNLKRRHLNESQRAMVAARLSNLGEGRPSETASIEAVSQDAAAATLNVSRASVQRAADVQARAEPELQRAVDRGHMAVSAAAQASKLTPDTQRRIAAQAEAGEINAVRSVIKQETRAARETVLGAKQQALPDKRYGIILADPEWRFDPYSRETGMDRAPENHYPTSSLDAIAARDVPSISADDCVLFLWATVPMLPQALTVMGAWGFNYKSHIIWHKDRIGTGYWFRNAHELMLVGTRGNIPAPAPGTQWASVVIAPVGAHSVKPEVFLKMIEEYFPSLPKIELNRRGPAHPGWDAWGNESLPPHDPETGEILVQDAVAPTPDASLGRPAPVMETAGAGTHSSEIDPYEIPDWLRRVNPPA